MPPTPAAAPAAPDPHTSDPHAPERGARALHKGQQTKAAIVDAALGLAAQIGLEGLSIGALAEVMRMSKSGVFAHFGSREELQISVIREYHARFEHEVFFPAMELPRGMPRLSALFENWMRRTSVEIDSGCIYIGGAVEFDDRPGPVRDALVSMVQAWMDAMKRALRQCQQEGHLRADANVQQVLFEIHGLILALHYEARFLRQGASADRARAGFNSVVQRYATAAGQSIAAGTAPASTKQPSRRRAARRSADHPKE